MKRPDIETRVRIVATALKEKPGRGTAGDQASQDALTELAVNFLDCVNRVADALEAIAGPR